MKKIVKEVTWGVVLSSILIGCGPASYSGMVDVVGVGVGPKVKSADSHFVDQTKLASINVLYADKIKIKEQKVSKTVKYVAGGSLVKEYSGEPELLAKYFNSVQLRDDNLVLIVDKNGVVAWEGHLRTTDFKNAFGVDDYGITGEDKISFDEAMSKFVGDGEEAEDYKKDKKIIFPKNNKEGFISGFNYDKRNPFLFVKLSDMSFTSPDGGTVNLSKFTSDGKPSVLIFYPSHGKKEADLNEDMGMAVDAFNMLRGKAVSKKRPSPARLLKAIEDTYLTK